MARSKSGEESSGREFRERKVAHLNAIYVPIPHLNAISRSSDQVSLKRDGHAESLQIVSRKRDSVAQRCFGTGHSRPGEPLLA